MKPLLNVCRSLIFSKTKPDFQDWKLRFIAEVTDLNDEQCSELAQAVIDRENRPAEGGEA